LLVLYFLPLFFFDPPFSTSEFSVLAVSSNGSVFFCDRLITCCRF